MGYIYKITNIQNKMMYIGQTTYELKERIRHHFNKTSNCRYLSNALKKFGKDNFKFEIICICFDNDLNRFEEEYITKYQTIVPNGYNLKSGGNSSRHNEETKKKISLSLKGRKILTPFPCLGRILTEEHKNFQWFYEKDYLENLNLPDL